MRSSFAVLLCGLLAGQAAAQPAVKPGVILVAHGAGAEWNSLIRRVAAEVEFRGPIDVSFLMGAEAATTSLPDVVDKMAAQGVTDITVVPLMISSHSEHYQQIRYLAGLTDSIDHALHAHMEHGGTGMRQAKSGARIIVTPALDDSPEMARILTDRARALLTDPARQAVFLVGHGPNSAEDYAMWMTNLRPVADSVKHWLGVADVRVDLVRDDAPTHVRREAVRRVRELIDMQRAITQLPVVVVPVLLSRGRVSREKFMADLDGLQVVYSGEPLLPHAEVSRWIARRIDSTLRRRHQTTATSKTP